MPYANELSKKGHSCTIAVESTDCPERTQKNDSLYLTVNYKEIRNNSKLLFPNSQPADLIHAWTPRENVRKLVEEYRTHNSHTTLIVHLEDNEDSILENYYQRSIDRLRFPTQEDKIPDWHPNLSHPNHYQRFLWEADAITTLTPSLLKLLPTPKPSLNIYPILDPATLSPRRDSQTTKSKYKIPSDKKLIVYPGGVTSNNREDIRNLYLAAKLLNDWGTPTLIAKIGPNCSDLEHSFDFDLNQVRIDLGILERSEINDLLIAADILVQPGKNSEFNRDRFPCKIPEFLLSGRPCIIPEIYKPHLPEGIDICHLTSTDSAEQIAKACAEVLAEPEKANKKAQQAVQFATVQYSSPKNGDKLIAFYEKVANNAKQTPSTPYQLDGDFRQRFLQSHSQLKETEQDVVKLNQDIKGFQDERSVLKSEIESLKNENNALNSKVARMNATFSWQSTAPLRFLRRKLVDPLKSATPPPPTPAEKQAPTPQEPSQLPPPGHPCYHKDYHSFVQAEQDKQPSRLSELHAKVEALNEKPKISVLLPVYDVAENWLRKCIDSVINQTYENWELCIADDASPSPHVRKTLEQYLAADTRIKAVFRPENGHISAASNSAFELATGDYIALLDHDDELPTHALARVAIATAENPKAKLIYSDEDKIDEQGIRHDPHFKTDWNYDFFLGCNMISHLGVYKRESFAEVGGFRLGLEGAQDWDLALRVSETCNENEIVHIPEILYHWRSIQGSTAAGLEHKNYAHPAQKRVLTSHLSRIGVTANVESVQSVNWRIAYEIPNPAPKVSIVIPTRNQVEHLQPCIESILTKTTYPEYEIIIADNDSDDPNTLFYLSNYQDDKRIRVVKTPGEFNFSQICNKAILQTDGELTCLLNNDTEIIDGSWLHEMVRHGLREEIGVVGAKLLFPHDHVQHCGIILGIYDIAGHAFKFLHKEDNGHIGRAKLVSAYSAVTGACMLFRRSIWQELGGLDERNLPISYNDVDFCLRAKEAGYRTILTPFATLYHKESISRGTETSAAHTLRFERESAYMRDRWKDIITRDPFYNPNLTREKEDFSYRDFD